MLFSRGVCGFAFDFRPARFGLFMTSGSRLQGHFSGCVFTRLGCTLIPKVMEVMK